MNGMKLSIQVFEHDDNKSFRLLGAPSEVFEHDDNKNFPNIVCLCAFGLVRPELLHGCECRALPAAVLAF